MMVRHQTSGGFFVPAPDFAAFTGYEPDDPQRPTFWWEHPDTQESPHQRYGVPPNWDPDDPENDQGFVRYPRVT